MGKYIGESVLRKDEIALHQKSNKYHVSIIVRVLNRKLMNKKNLVNMYST